jgi:Alpha-L-arabinofuranosidase B, catalytic/Carbohydrate binding module (family 6)
MLSMTLPRWLRLAAAFVLAAALAIPMFNASAPAHAAASLPCDIYAAGGTPCEAAYSTTRALYASYDGPLYRVQRASDSTYLTVGLESAGGVVNSAPEVSFCAGTTCTITELYDQTPNGNNMPISPGTSCSGCSHGNAGPGPNGMDIGAPAMPLPVTVGGQPAYGMLFDNFGTGYRIENALNVPTGSQPEGIYMLTSSNLTSNQCCYDFGSAETNNSDDGNTTMNAIYYGTDCWTRNCTGPGPWAGGDLENGMYFSAAGNNPASIPSESGTFVSAWEKNNGTTNFTLKYGNGQSGGLTEAYSGALPSGYDPMHVQNSIELGTGGDNTGQGLGEFFEAAVVSGFPSDATENAVQASITAAGYAPASDKPFGGSAAAVPGTVQAANYDTGGFDVAFRVVPPNPLGTGINGTGDGYRSDGVNLEATSDTQGTSGGGAYDLGWTGSGQWFKYTVNVATAGTYTVGLRLASPSGVTDGLHIANSSGTNLSGNINVPATGAWQTWTTVNATVTLPAGQQTLTIDQDNGGWNIHQLTFANSSGTTGSCGELTANQQLTANQSVASCNGDYSLIMQGDGNLVLYQGSTALWASNTVGSGADEAIMQGDGNFVLYTSAGSPVWASNTPGNSGAYLEVQNDGNVVVYSASGTVLWSTGTAGK